MPNHWRSYFAVDDADATALEVVAEGGRIVLQPFDIPWARLLGRQASTTVCRAAVLADQQGGLFGVITAQPR
jgi:hypothetical protein